MLEHGDAAKEIYGRAAELTQGWESWVFRLAMGWVDRLTVRAGTEASSERPARYGDLSVNSQPHRSTGGYLREQYGDAVYSIGLFMGRGRIADNRRKVREVAALDPRGVEGFLNSTDSPASYLVLRGNTDPVVREWANEIRPYLRMGLHTERLVLADEFDALLYVDHVGPPDYEILLLRPHLGNDDH